MLETSNEAEILVKRFRAGPDKPNKGHMLCRRRASCPVGRDERATIQASANDRPLPLAVAELPRPDIALFRRPRPSCCSA
jgi:hypothetical protein